MSDVVLAPEIVMPPVDHLQLPCDDGAMVHNFQEHPQAMILTDSIMPVARRLYGNRFTIGQVCAIYYRYTDPPLDGAKAPDLLFVPDVVPLPDGEFRRSYVMWREVIAPAIVLEFVSGDGTEERDTTPETGKFWAYERAIRPAYYGIFESLQNRLEMYRHVEGRFVRMEPNLHGRYSIAPLGLELGLVQGTFLDMTLPWMRWWDADGQILLTGNDRAEQEKQRAEQEKQRAEQEKQRAEQEKQRAEQEKQRAEQEKQRAEQEKQRAEQEKQRAEQEKQRADLLAARLRELGVDPDSK